MLLLIVFASINNLTYKGLAVYSWSILTLHTFSIATSSSEQTSAERLSQIPTAFEGEHEICSTETVWEQHSLLSKNCCVIYGGKMLTAQKSTSPPYQKIYSFVISNCTPILLCLLSVWEPWKLG